MKEEIYLNSGSSQEMTEMQEAVYQVEAFLSENYQFRRNVLSGKTEVVKNNEETEEWRPVTQEVFNSIVRHAKKEGIGGDKSPRQNIEEYINSESVPQFDPIHHYLSNLPEWDGKNYIAELFSRIPGITSEQLHWCAVWMRSAVAHWLALDMLHGNECIPILIGKQGCGKSTFAYQLLPPELRTYYLDHINFGNKFDSEMALTHNLLVNIDEFDKLGTSQQAKLKQTLSKVKVNGRPIFGKSQDDRRRYASFVATTNDEHPLCDPTGSRRYICIRVKKGQLIDNQTPINYRQLYAQVVHELRHEQSPYWFSNDQVERIQNANLPYYRSDDMECIIANCYRLPESGEEGEWVTGNDIIHTIQKQYPAIKVSHATKVRIGQTLRFLGCQPKHTRNGAVYNLVTVAA